MEEKFEAWCVLELMGHRRLAGKVTDAEIGGGSFIRIDMPMKDGSMSTQFYTPGAVYCITPTTEEIARTTAIHNQPEPVNRWEFKQLVAPNGSDFSRDDPRDGWPNVDPHYDDHDDEDIT